MPFILKPFATRTVVERLKSLIEPRAGDVAGLSGLAC